MYCFPCRRATALSVGKWLLEKIIPVWGIVSGLPSDWGTQFTAQIIKSIYDIWPVINSHCTYHPQSLGSVEKFNGTATAAAAKSLQLCPTLCDPIDGSPPGFPIPGILQERILEWVATSFSNAWKWKVKVKSLSRVWLLATPWTAAYQAPPSMEFSRQEYWSGLPLTFPLMVVSKLNWWNQLQKKTL